MNGKMIRYTIGKMLGVEALLLLVPAFVGWFYEEESAICFLVTAGVLTFIYLLAGIKKPEDSTIYGKDGMIIVASAWIFWSLFGSLPFVLSDCIPNYIDALFETVSGFTATGATVLKDIESLPKCMLFWRNFMQWIGGMGVLVFVMVLTDLDKKSSMYLMRAELPGPEKDKLVPKMASTARILYGIYLGMTVIMVVLLVVGGMNLFDSFIHAFGTAGTGGFSNYNASAGHFDSVYIESVMTIFMILFGVNFNLYFFLILGEVKAIFKNEELRAYLLIIIIAAAAITLNISGQYESIAEAFRYAMFQVSAIITTSGYTTTDYAAWPMFSQCILFLLMLSGACASSTAGGIKVSRVLIVLKSIKKEIKQMVHPKSVSIIRVNEKKVGSDTLGNVYIYMLSYLVLLIISVLIISLDNFDFVTTFSSSIATLNNIGPGMALIGPTGNYADFSILSKLVFCFNMLAGRLEIFPFLMLFTAFRWKKRF